MESFDTASLAAAVGPLPGWKRVAFMAYCCERMLPNYRSFHAESAYGDASVLRGALDAIWEWIQTGQFSRDAAELGFACEQQAPDTTEFSSIYTSAALDVATATAATIEAIAEATEDKVVEVASLARDTVDLFVQEINELDPNDPDLEVKIAGSGLMQAELRVQRESLGTLKSLHGERAKAGGDLRLRWSNLREGSLPFLRHS